MIRSTADLSDMPRVSLIAVVLCVTALTARPARAQIGDLGNLAGCNYSSVTQQRISGKHLLLIGNVVVECEDRKLYTDQMELFEDEDRALLTGNVAFSQGENHISSESAEFNTKTGLGTFYHALGYASLRNQQRRPVSVGLGAGGIQAPTGQDDQVYFFGDVVEKQGAKKYKITNGGISTCLQPTPRWELSGDTLILNIDHYTLLTNAIFRVKDVPMFYTPILYFPTKEEGRVTGFLLPTYSYTDLRGHEVDIPFFWAINRSQDMTVEFDNYSRTGTGTGVEYRYNQGGGSDGAINFFSLNEHETTYTRDDGSSFTQGARNTFWLQGGANRLLPGNLRARAHIDYFSDFSANQTYSTNVYQTTNARSTYGGNIVGVWRSYFLNATFDRNRTYVGGASTDSSVNGGTPRINIRRTERPIGRSQLYFGFAGDAGHIENQRVIGGVVSPELDLSLGRFDFAPTIRYPFKRWQWLTVNTSVAWQGTFYSRSYSLAVGQQNDPDYIAPRPIDESVYRQFTTAGIRIDGPVFSRVFDTPNSAYASRLKHSIEPYLEVARTTAIETYDRIIKADGNDGTRGDTTRVTYGLNNRIFAKRKIGQFDAPMEILNVSISQQYYSDALAALYDPRANASSTLVGPSSTLVPPSKLQPVLFNVRATPANAFQGTMSAEFDTTFRQWRSLTVGGTHVLSQRVNSSLNWTRRYFIEGLQGFEATSARNYLVFSTNARTIDNKYVLNYSLNHDFQQNQLVQQRVSASYNAQCCGVAVEFMRYNYSNPNLPLPADTRFFLSFTLAGLGNFSPFSGGLTGVR